MLTYVDICGHKTFFDICHYVDIGQLNVDICGHKTYQKKCLYADICPHMSLGGLKNTLCGHRTYVHEMWAYVDICHAAISHSVSPYFISIPVNVLIKAVWAAYVKVQTRPVRTMRDQRPSRTSSHVHQELMSATGSL